MRRDVSRPRRKPRRDVLAQDGRRRAQARLIRQEALNSVMGKAVVKTVQAIPYAALCLEHADRLVPDTQAHTHDGQRQVPRDRPDIRAQLTGSFTYVDQRFTGWRYEPGMET